MKNNLMENKNILLCFKSNKDLHYWEKNDMSDFFKRSIRLSGHCYQIGDKIYKAAVMNCTLEHGYLPNEVYFINCFSDDCEDEKFIECLGFWESLGTVVHYW